ncbi:MAG: AI-2E family transporter [Veillonellaceae bacterium]|nr:AI-2E family transporter [Veillonellaceae bacterium]
MGFFKRYQGILGLILIGGLVFVAAIRFQSLTSTVRLLFDALTPLIIGGVIAFVLNIIVKRYEAIFWPKSQTRWVCMARRPLCILFAIISVALGFSFVGYMAIPQLTKSLTIIIQGVPDVYTAVSGWLIEVAERTPFLTSAVVTHTLSLDSWTNNISQYSADTGRYIVRMMGNAVEMFFDGIIGFIFALYILADKHRVGASMKRLLQAYVSDKHVGQCEHVLNVTSKTFSNFFIGQFLDAVILGILVGVFLEIFGISYAVTIACVVGLTALIPLFGSYIGACMSVLMLIPKGPMETVFFLVIFIIMHELESNVIYPRIVGNTVGLPGIWVFAAVVLGGALYGIIGIVFSVPILATIYKLLREDIYRRLDKKRISEN